jgi:hypothetical protein
MSTHDHPTIPPLERRADYDRFSRAFATALVVFEANLRIWKEQQSSPSAPLTRREHAA